MRFPFKTNLPSTVRDGVPAQSAQNPPSLTILVVASHGPSKVVVTRHLMDSRGVPPVRSDAIRSAAPRMRFLPSDDEACFSMISSQLQIHVVINTAE